jgi:N-acetylglutamate synthase-like GNAT family acetyltransferase
MSAINIRRIQTSDYQIVLEKVIDSWGSEIVVAHGTIFHPAEMPGFGIFIEEQLKGLITYHIENGSCEIITLNSWKEAEGFGTSLIEEVKLQAVQAGCRRLWLITTNDNTHALTFYQKRGFIISDIRISALEASRSLKPEIPLIGSNGIPIRDEIEMEMLL